MSVTPRIVIHKFSPNSKNETYAPGIADFFKGSIALYQYSKIYNFKLYLDFSEHPIYEFLENNNVPSFPDAETLELYNTTPPFLKAKMETALQESGVIKIQCNLDYEMKPDDETIQFILNNFRPTKYINDKVVALKKSLELDGDDFWTIHVRAGDTFMIQNSAKEFDRRFLIYFQEGHAKNLIKLLDYMRQYYDGKVFLISDNTVVRSFVSNKYKFQTTDFIPMHSGALAKENSSLRTEEMLIEWLVMCSSSKVLCYALVGHSGFSDMANILFKIPLETHFI